MCVLLLNRAVQYIILIGLNRPSGNFFLFSTHVNAAWREKVVLSHFITIVFLYTLQVMVTKPFLDILFGDIIIHFCVLWEHFYFY